MNLNTMADKIYKDNKKKGFWPKNRKPAECIALIHSEASEALEAIREGKYMNAYEDINKREGSKGIKEVLIPIGVNEEMADIIIRVLDFCGRYNMDIENSIKRKLAYNKTRPHKHGKKF